MRCASRRWCAHDVASFTRRVLDNTFGNPRGLLGRLGGAVMAYGNAATELQVVRLARLSASDTVLVIGPGPGVGLRAAGLEAAHAVGVEPSVRMRETADKRCADLVRDRKVELCDGTAEATGQPDSAFTTVISVNNAMLWPDRAAALAELYRVLRPGGTLLISTHARWLPGGRAALTTDVETAGFDEVQSWAWEPPTPAASTAIQLRARRPAT